MQEQQHSSMPPPAATTATTAVYGGFWKRFGALVVDGILLLVAAMIIGLVMPQNIAQWAMFAISAGYYIFMHGRYGATCGKMALNMRVCKRDGSDIDFAIAAMRYSPFIVFGIGTLLLQPAAGGTPGTATGMWGLLQLLFLVASVIVLVANAQKRTIHDMLAGTVVVNKKPDDLVTV